MGTLSINKVDHLLWLGRYMERSFTTMSFIVSTYDAALDNANGAWQGQLEELGFDRTTDDPIEFFNTCLFDVNHKSSLRYSMNAAYDNAVHLRDVIGTETLAYVQMASNSIDAAEHSDAPLLDLQSVHDDIMAFKGCVDEYVDNDAARTIIKCGMSIERLDLFTRLSYQLEKLPQEVHRLATRIDRAAGTGYSKAHLKVVIETVFDPAFPGNMTYERQGELLTHIAGIFG
ncbi:MAG: alpha-E domain-containing protein [Coriobacteriales bacterium]|nr:alpha-E domain-containing protein [Coriobacteriales bacterium]